MQNQLACVSCFVITSVFVYLLTFLGSVFLHNYVSKYILTFPFLQNYGEILVYSSVKESA